jgi:hypothetical protein
LRRKQLTVVRRITPVNLLQKGLKRVAKIRYHRLIKLGKQLLVLGKVALSFEFEPLIKEANSLLLSASCVNPWVGEEFANQKSSNLG